MEKIIEDVVTVSKPAATEVLWTSTSTRQGQQPVEVLRKKVLLQILAENEAKRLGISVSKADLQLVIDSFRVAFGLEKEEKMVKWLQEEDIPPEYLIALARSLAIVNKLEEWYASDIEQCLPQMLKLETARTWRDRDNQPVPESGFVTGESWPPS